MHLLVDVLQNWLLEQSPSTMQPPAGSHTPDVEHAPERHRVGPLAGVQGPSPFAKPHLASGSHTALLQTVEALPEVHAPSPFANPHLLSSVSQTSLVHTAEPTG